MANITYDKEKISLNTARLKKNGLVFEIAIDADLAIAFKKGDEDNEIDIRDVLKSEDIFSDVKKGELASDKDIKEVFKTENVLEATKQIIQKGDIQLTADYRQKLRDEKRRKIIQIIHQNGIDPRTKLPIPVTRIENAFTEARIMVDEIMSAEDQVSDIVKKMMPIFPVSFQKRTIDITIPSTFAGKCYSIVSTSGKLEKDEWLNDGSWHCVVTMPAGMVQGLYDKLNKQTHGDMQTKELE